MLFSELYKTMVNKVTFVGFRGGGDRPLPGSAPGAVCVGRCFPIQPNLLENFYTTLPSNVQTYGFSITYPTEEVLFGNDLFPLCKKKRQYP